MRQSTADYSTPTSIKACRIKDAVMVKYVMIQQLVKILLSTYPQQVQQSSSVSSLRNDLHLFYGSKFSLQLYAIASNAPTEAWTIVEKIQQYSAFFREVTHPFNEAMYHHFSTEYGPTYDFSSMTGRFKLTDPTNRISIRIGTIPSDFVPFIIALNPGNAPVERTPLLHYVIPNPYWNIDMVEAYAGDPLEFFAKMDKSWVSTFQYVQDTLQQHGMPLLDVVYAGRHCHDNPTAYSFVCLSKDHKVAWEYIFIPNANSLISNTSTGSLNNVYVTSHRTMWVTLRSNRTTSYGPLYVDLYWNP